MRKIDPHEFWAVTPSAREQGVSKDHYVIVDCVELTDEDRAWAETRPLDRQPTVPLKTLLREIAQGITADDVLSTAAARLNRLQGKLTGDEEEEIEQLAGIRLEDIAANLIKATDETTVKEVVEAELGEDRMTDRGTVPLVRCRERFVGVSRVGNGMRSAAGCRLACLGLSALLG